jgi:hypothetical protein
MKRVMFAFYLISTFFALSSVHADTISLPSVPADSVYFWNSANKMIYINISVDSKNWTEVAVDSEKSAVVSVAGVPQNVFVAIQTGDAVFRGEVQLKSRYEIYWNDGDQEFAVRPLVPR